MYCLAGYLSFSDLIQILLNFMANPFVAEIRMFGCNFAPAGWALCNGQILPLSQNTALFSLIGTTYGGNGKTNFALPDLQGKAALHSGQGPGLSLYDLGQTGGTSSVTLLTTEIPSHKHGVNAVAVANAADPTNMQWANAAGRPAPNLFASAITSSTNMNSAAIANTGGDLPHNNLMPFMAINFCIALQGVFPPRS